MTPRSIRSLPVLGVIAVLVFIAIGGTAYAVASGSPAAGPQEAVAFANVLEDGTVDPPLSSNNLPQSAITHPAPGVYCVNDPGFTITSGIVSGDNSFANNDTLASVALDNTGEGLSGCPATASSARIRTFDLNGVAGSNSATYDPKLIDHRFVIWLRGTKK
jgi:hypothetical protein